MNLVKRYSSTFCDMPITTLGLSLPSNESDTERNFLWQLKARNIISKRSIQINVDKKGKTNLIIGKKTETELETYLDFYTQTLNIFLDSDLESKTSFKSSVPGVEAGFGNQKLWTIEFNSIWMEDEQITSNRD